MFQKVSKVTHDLVIVIIEAIAALLFLTATILSFKVFLRTKKTTDIWLLISFVAFMAFLTSSLNAFEWIYSESMELDMIGEYTSIIFSIAWIYIAYRFVLFKSLSKE